MKQNARKKALIVTIAGCAMAFGVALATTGNGTIAASADTAPTIDGYTFAGYRLKWDEDTTFEAGISGDSAFQFTMQITDTIKESITGNVKTGTLIFPDYYLDGAELTVESESGNAKPINLDTTNAWKDMGENIWQNVTYLKNVPSNYYASKVVVRGYYFDGTTYQYGTQSNPKSLAELVNADLKDSSSTRSDAEKEAILNALNTFNVTIDGTPVTYHYGETLEAANAGFGKTFVGYSATNDATKLWNLDTPVTGPIWLKTQVQSAKQYYSLNEKKGTFAVEGLTEGVTTASINGTTVECTTTDGEVTLNDITGTVTLESGKSYALTVGEKTVGFTCVDNYYQDVPYAAGDILTVAGTQLGYSETATVTALGGEGVSDTAVTTANKDEKLVLSGIAANETNVAENKQLLIQDGDTYSIVDLDVVKKVF